MAGLASGNCGPMDSWQCTAVDSEGSVGRFASLAAWGSGLLRQVHVAYHLRTASSEGVLKYARYVGSGGNCADDGWDCQEIEETGSDDSMGLDLVASLATTAIVYMGSGDLRNASRQTPGNCGPLELQDGGGWARNWQCETLVEGTTQVLPGRGAAMKVDGVGEPLVAYSQEQVLLGSRGLRVAYPWVGRDNLESGDTTAWSSVAGEE